MCVALCEGDGEGEWVARDGDGEADSEGLAESEGDAESVALGLTLGLGNDGTVTAGCDGT